MMILCTTVAVAAFGVSSYGMVSNAQNEDDTEAWVSFEDADWEDEAAEDETISYGEKKTDRSVDATEMVDMKRQRRKLRQKRIHRSRSRKRKFQRIPGKRLEQVWTITGMSEILQMRKHPRNRNTNTIPDTYLWEIPGSI